jgi:biopolymer transport protein TolR
MKMKKVKFDPRTLSEINVTPLVDVLLVLLVIFMISAPYLTQGITVNLPKAASKQLDAQDGKTIIVDKDKNIYLEGEKISKELLVTYLSRLASQPKQVPIFIRADSRLIYGDVIDIMGMIKQTGIETVAMITEPKATQ